MIARIFLLMGIWLATVAGAFAAEAYLRSMTVAQANLPVRAIAIAVSIAVTLHLVKCQAARANFERAKSKSEEVTPK